MPTIAADLTPLDVLARGELELFDFGGSFNLAVNRFSQACGDAVGLTVGQFRVESMSACTIVVDEHGQAISGITSIRGRIRKCRRGAEREHSNR